MSSVEHKVSPGVISSQQNPSPLGQALEAEPGIQPRSTTQIFSTRAAWTRD